jgi:hypothetical protein
VLWRRCLSASKFSNFFAGLRHAKAVTRLVVIRSAKSHDGRHDHNVQSSSILALSSSTMAAPASRALRRCICTAKQSAYVRPTIGATQQRIQRRWQSDAAAPTNPKIATIVDQISQLTLLETADLVSTLKVRRQLRGGNVAVEVIETNIGGMR